MSMVYALIVSGKVQDIQHITVNTYGMDALK